MKVKKLFADIFLIPATPIVVIAVLFTLPIIWVFNSKSLSRPLGDRGKVYDTQEVSSDIFKVRIAAHYETGVYLGGAYYVFYSAPVNSNDWREFIWKRRDDPISIPIGMFHFVDDYVGYTSTGAKYAVTLNGGRSWSYWEAETELPPDWQYSYKEIKDVKVEVDGTGVMYLYPFHDKDIEVPELHTQDYGQHWNVVYETSKSNKGMLPARR